MNGNDGVMGNFNNGRPDVAYSILEDKARSIGHSLYGLFFSQQLSQVPQRLLSSEAGQWLGLEQETGCWR